MKILDISVDGFGTFSGLKLKDLSESVSVLYGRNEAGKTTLLQFVRTMLYGLTHERRTRYLPPQNGGTPGGSLRVATPTGTYTINRILDAGPGRDRFADDKVSVIRRDNDGGEGSEQGGHALRVLLSGVDEQSYRNVYAVGLREMQELGTLSDTEAARHLYDLSAGLDRVSLIDVLRHLKLWREQLLNGSNPESKILQLLERRDELRDQLKRVRQSLGRYNNLTSERARLFKQISQLEAERSELERDVRVAELASTLFERWQQLQTIRRRIDDLGSVPAITNEDVQQLEKLGDQIRIRQHAYRKLKVQRQQRREQATSYPINESLRVRAARVEALAEQRDWIQSLDDRIEQLDGEIGRRETSLVDKRRSLGIEPNLAIETREDRQATISKLRGPAQNMRQAKARLKKVRRQAIELREAREADADQLNAETSSRGTADLAVSVNAATDRVEQLKQRVEIDEQLDKLEQKAMELKEDRDILVDRHVLPSWGLAAGGLAFAFGCMLIMMGVLTAIYSTGWPYILFGLVIVGAVLVTKLMFEHTAEMDLDSCEHSLSVLDAKFKKVRKARDELDAHFQPGGGPLLNQLRKAQQELAQLQSLVPLQNKQQDSLQQEHSDTRRVAELRDDYQQSRKQWFRTLHDVGLRANLSPKRAKQVLMDARRLAQQQQFVDRRREEARHRRGELSSCVERVATLLEEVGLERISGRLIDQVDQLIKAHSEQEQWVERRDAILKESHQLRRQQLTVSREIHKLQARRREMLEKADAESPDHFCQLAKSYAESVDLKDKRKRLHSQITTAISGVCEQQQFKELMRGSTAEKMVRRWEKLSAKLEDVDTRLKETFEKRGRLTEQLRSLADDRRATQKQLELNAVQQQLRDAKNRWRELAVTSRLLQSIRRRYEKERQPATLREASQYFHQMTDGRYGRIWTLLDEDALCVDDNKGRSLTPENLSRGTREQLFLSLRLALVTQNAQRGVQLPLVLDDVFVNFDSQRATAAAKVLQDFAALGHQVLIFTCHEHILQIFDGVNADTRRLHGEKPAPIKPVVKKKVDDPPAPQPKPAFAPKRAPQPVPIAPPPLQPVDAEATWEVDDEEIQYTEVAKVLEPTTTGPGERTPTKTSEAA